MSRVSRGLFVFSLVLLAALPGVARPQDAPPANPLQKSTPDAQTGKAPDWVRPGALITYWVGGVSLEGTRETIWVEDPRGPLVDYEGNHYRIEVPRARAGNRSENNVGGHGYSQVSIVATTDRDVLLEVRAFVMDDVKAPPVLSGASGGRTDLATGNGLWMDPAKLAKARSTPDRKVLTGPYRLGESTYDVVVFSAGKLARVYDKGTGLLLVESIQDQSRRGWVLRNGFLSPAPPRSTGSLMLFRTFRQVTVPWAGKGMPKAAKKCTKLVYQGGTTTSMAGSGSMSIPSTVTIERENSGPNWIEYTHHFLQPAYGTLPEQKTDISQVWGPAMVGGAWLPPDGMKGLKTGQVLDEDPVLRSTLSVKYVGPGPDGKPIVRIGERAAGFTDEWVYDAGTGALLGFGLSHQEGLATTTYSYRLVRME